MLGVTVAVFAFCGSTAGYAFDRLLTSKHRQRVPVTGQPRVRDWVDRAAAGRSGCSHTPSRAPGTRAPSPGGTPSSGTTRDEGVRRPRRARSRTRRSRARRSGSTRSTDRFDGTEHAPPYVLAARERVALRPGRRPDGGHRPPRAARRRAAVPGAVGDRRPRPRRLDAARPRRRDPRLRGARARRRSSQVAVAARRAAGGRRRPPAYGSAPRGPVPPGQAGSAARGPGLRSRAEAMPISR